MLPVDYFYLFRGVTKSPWMPLKWKKESGGRHSKRAFQMVDMLLSHLRWPFGFVCGTGADIFMRTCMLGTVGVQSRVFWCRGKDGVDTENYKIFSSLFLVLQTCASTVTTIERVVIAIGLLESLALLIRRYRSFGASSSRVALGDRTSGLMVRCGSSGITYGRSVYFFWWWSGGSCGSQSNRWNDAPLNVDLGVFGFVLLLGALRFVVSE